MEENILEYRNTISQKAVLEAVIFDDFTEEEKRSYEEPFSFRMKLLHEFYYTGFN